jgi:outer membrane protein
MKRPLAVMLFLLAPAVAAAQQPAALTLEQAIQYGVEHYPSVQAALEEVHASSAGVNVARASYLPRLDALWQSNRATVNNIFGQVFPQSVIPSMSGPVLASATAGSVWGSAAGALFSWEAVDFGLRSATVAAADAAVARARAGEALTRLEVQAAVGNAFLGVVSAQRAVVATQADLDRRDLLARVIHTLVANELRPGAEGSRIDAERAAASTRLIQAQTSLTLAQSALGRVLGFRAGPVTIDAGHLFDELPANLGNSPPSGHPLAVVRQTAVDAAKAQEEVLARTDRPRLYLQSSVFARGSGANPNGDLDGGLNGLGLDRANWAAGVQLVLPNLFDAPSLHARKAGAAATRRAEAARYDEAILTIENQQQAAAAMVSAARAVAANMPAQLAAAQQNEAQARARYQAGLTGLVEVADAQSLLAQTEYQAQLVRVDVWRALLAEAVAYGSLTPFLARLHGAP